MTENIEKPAPSSCAGSGPALRSSSSRRSGVTPDREAEARKSVVVPTDASDLHRMIAWAILKSARGQTMRQGRILALQSLNRWSDG